MSRRAAKISPEALRSRVLSAVPEWGVWPRRLRQLYVLLPVFGPSASGLEDACTALRFDKTLIQTLLSANPSFATRVREYAASSAYPHIPLFPAYPGGIRPSAAPASAQEAIPRRILHRELAELLANEQTAIALVQLEAAGDDASPVLAKIVNAAGYYANIEAAATERRARSEADIVQRVAEEARRKASKKSPPVPGGTGLFGRPAPAQALAEAATTPDTSPASATPRIESQRPLRAYDDPGEDALPEISDADDGDDEPGSPGGG